MRSAIRGGDLKESVRVPGLIRPFAPSTISAVPVTYEDPRWSPATKTVVVIGITLVLVGVTILLREILRPLILAGILAYLLSPVSQRVEQRLHLGRGWATGVVYLLLLAILVAAVGILIPVIVEQLDNLNLDVKTILTGFETFLGTRIVLGGFSFDIQQLLTEAARALDVWLQPLFGRTLGLAFDLLTSVLWLVFVFVVSFYFVRDRERLALGFDSLWPPTRREDARRLRLEVDLVWRAFFIGQLLLAIVVAALFAFIGPLVGLPFPMAMAALAGLLEFLPSIGHGIWMVTAGLLMLFHGSTWLPIPPWAAAALIVGIHLVFQQVDLNILIPRLVGRRMRLHPIVVIIGVLSGAAVAGVLGVVLAAPVIASARMIGGYLKANLYDEDPFPLDKTLPAEPARAQRAG